MTTYLDQVEAELTRVQELYLAEDAGLPWDVLAAITEAWWRLYSLAEDEPDASALLGGCGSYTPGAVPQWIPLDGLWSVARDAGYAAGCSAWWTAVQDALVQLGEALQRADPDDGEIAASLSLQAGTALDTWGGVRGSWGDAWDSTPLWAKGLLFWLALSSVAGIAGSLR